MPDDNEPEHTASAGGEQATGANSSQRPEEPATAVQATASGSEPQAASIGILPADHWAQVSQAHPADDNDAESALGSDAASTTASLTSDILRYRTILGRTYHSEVGNARYWGSNDEQQNESMDINHHTLTLGCGGKLYLAPLEKDKVQKAVDIGTGTGIWAIDFADEFPGAEVIGTDISPIQPTWVPPNLKFEIEDCTGEWTFQPESLDYIHLRWLLGSIFDWTALFKQAYRCCRPGGWVESFEAMSRVESDDGTVKEDSAMGQWGKFFDEGGKKIGMSFTVVEDGIQRKAMEEAGFTDIAEHTFKVPLGSWPKDPQMRKIGQFAQLVLETDVEGYILFMANTIGWSRTEIQVYVAQLRREIRLGKNHGYYRQRIVWGRKPVN